MKNCAAVVQSPCIQLAESAIFPDCGLQVVVLLLVNKALDHNKIWAKFEVTPTADVLEPQRTKETKAYLEFYSFLF